jgi:hypothetical protein
MMNGLQTPLSYSFNLRRYILEQWRLLKPDVTAFDDQATVDATLTAGSMSTLPHDKKHLPPLYWAPDLPILGT